MLLNRQQILNAKDQKTTLVDVPEWGEGAQVRIRSLTLGEADVWRRSLLVKEERSIKGKVTSEMVLDYSKAAERELELLTLACIDEQGAQVFLADDAARMKALHTAPVKRIVEAITKLSGLNTEEKVEEAVKN